MDSTATYDRDVLEKKLHDPTAPPIFLPIQFLKDITCNFSGEQELGRGGYGVVYKGVLQSGKIIAVKKIFDIHLVEDDKFHREASYLIGIKHQNIVQLIGYCAESRWEAIELPCGIKFVEVPTRLLCFEYLCNESLDKYVSDESSGLDWYKRFEIIKGICSGLHFLHEKHIVHLDLKPENILMDASMMPKVADFGLSKLLGAEKSRTIINGNLAGSRGYMAPEYSFQGVISLKADIFSFGVITIEIITGRRDYPLVCTVPDLQHFGSQQSIEISVQEYTERVLGRWRSIFQKEPKHTSSEVCTQQVKECISIALKCVDYDSARRPNARDIFQMLRGVESTNCHSKDIKDPLVYQVQEELRAGQTMSRQRRRWLPAKQPTWKLAFKTRVQLPVYMGRRIMSASGDPLEIILVDADGSPAAVSPQMLSLELVPLAGDFPPDGREDWGADEFQTNIVLKSEGWLPLLKGDVSLTMRHGRATVGELVFTECSRSGKSFRIGVRVVPGSFPGASRIREAITNAFVVETQRIGRNRKHYPPVLRDQVWRLDKIAKEGAFHRKLADHHVNTVQDFVRMLVVKPNELRAILGEGMSDPMWEKTTKHAMTCVPDDRVYVYISPRGTIYVNSLFNLLKAEFDGVECPLEQLNTAQANLILEAYDNRDSLQEVDPA